jgi:hypothetical protein
MLCIVEVLICYEREVSSANEAVRYGVLAPLGCPFSSRSSMLYTEDISSYCEFLAVKLTSMFQGSRVSKYLPPQMEDLFAKSVKGGLIRNRLVDSTA